MTEIFNKIRKVAFKDWKEIKGKNEWGTSNSEENTLYHERLYISVNKTLSPHKYVLKQTSRF